MNMLVKSLKAEANKTTTTNGDVAFKSTTDNLVDLFYKIGACSDPEEAIPLFDKAYHQDPDMAVRILLYARDIRGGMGMRQVFRTVLKHIAETNPLVAKAIIPKIPELGRWDDLFSLFGTPAEKQATFFWGYHLAKGNKNASKWAPRERSSNKREAKILAKMIGCKPHEYRKLIAGNAQTVETLMSAKRWDKIDFSTVPSIAAARYQKSFAANAGERYTEYRNSLINGSPDVKVNAGAIFPHTIIESVGRGDNGVAAAQWDALPNYMEDCPYNILPMIDVSASMHTPVMGNTTAMAVAVALGLYVSERASGAFKDSFITFDAYPEFVHLDGLDFSSKVSAIRNADWGGSTNFHAAYTMILQAALANTVPVEDMPDMMIVFSDMQFDDADRDIGMKDTSTSKVMDIAYENHGYKKPIIVFWNIDGHSTVPVTIDDNGNVLVSGFSPAIMKSILSMDLNNMSPIALVNTAVNTPRYDWNFTENVM